MTERSRRVVASYVPVFCRPEMHHIYRQVAGLDRWRAHVITGRWERPKVFHLHKRWITVLPKYRWRFFRRLWFTQLRREPWTLSRGELERLLMAVQTHGAQVVHIYFGHMALHLLPLLEVSPWPVVVSFHGADAGVDMERPRQRAMMRQVFRHASIILARSQALLNDLAALGCPRGKLRLNRTGIPLDRFTFQDRPPPEDGRWILLQAGRLIEKKGIDTTLHAFAKLRRQFPRAVLRIAGEGPLLDQFMTLADELDITPGVEWTGFLGQMKLLDAMREAHVFLHPSRTAADGNREGVPNAMLEAMATGLPVAATRHGGIPEAVEHGTSGLLVDEGDDDALAEAITALLGNPDQRTRMGRAAASRVQAAFSLPACVQSLEAAYDQAAASKHHPFHPRPFDSRSYDPRPLAPRHPSDPHPHPHPQPQPPET